MTNSGPVATPEGGTAKVTLTTPTTGGFNSAINSTASGQPNGVSVSFIPSTITGTGSSAVSFQAAPTVPAGSYPITLSGTSARHRHAKTSATTVAAHGDQARLRIDRWQRDCCNGGQYGGGTIASAVSGGFNSAITLSAAGQPAGVAVGFSPVLHQWSGHVDHDGASCIDDRRRRLPDHSDRQSGALLHSAVVNVSVSVPDFALSASPGTLAVLQGMSGTFSLSSSATGGFAAPITLTASGQPGGVAVSFSPASISGAGSTTVKVSAAAGTAAGSYPIVLAGTSGAIKHSVTMTLSVGSATFTISGAAPSMAALQGASTSMSLTSAASGVLGAPVALSVSGQPAGVTATLSTTSLTPPGSVLLSIVVAANTAAGSYPITILGASGSVTAKAAVTLVVSSPIRPAFSFAVSTTALSVTRGTSATFMLQTALTGSPVPAIAFAVSGLPAGVTASFSPSIQNGAGVSIVTLTAAAGAAPGAATLNFSATAGSSVQSSTVSLTLR